MDSQQSSAQRSTLSNNLDLQQFILEASQKFICSYDLLLKQLHHASMSEFPVLIQGPTGSGKELIAEIVHEYGGRCDKPFVPVNCALIPKDDLYSELFGVEARAFTDVRKSRRGLFREADGGTIFLDEIGDLPGDAQAGLLRVLETGRVKSLGQDESEAVSVDVRVVAATNKEVQDSQVMREDLYYRLNVVPIRVDSLASRGSDVPALMKKFLLDLGCRYVDFHFYAFCLLYDWPGNVRQLLNFCRYASIYQFNGTVRLFEFVDSFFTGPNDDQYAQRDYFDTRWADGLNFMPPNWVDFEYRGRKWDWGAIPPELREYLDFLRLLQHKMVVEDTALALRVKIERKSSHPARGEAHSVLLFRYPILDLTHISDVDPGYPYGGILRLRGAKSTDDVTEDQRNARRMWGFSLRLFEYRWEFFQRMDTHKEASTSLDALPIVHAEARELFERRYYGNVFKRYGHLRDGAIANIIGQDPHTVKKKRELYHKE